MNRPARQRVLVLGSAGFFGRWICRDLNDRGFEVMPATRESGDLLDPDGLRRLIGKSRPAAVVNAAGMTSPASARANPAGCFELNVSGVLNLLEAVRQEAPQARVVALSSAAVYSGEPPFSETSMTAADTPYTASKLAMEILCGQYSRGHGLAVTVLRCFNLTGPGEPASQVTSEFTLAGLAASRERAGAEVRSGTGSGGGRIEIEVGHAATSRDFTDVRDAARAISLLAGSEATGTFNLCSGRSASLTDLAAMIGSQTGVRIDLRETGAGRPARGVLHSHGDGGKLNERTGWEPRISLQRSLHDLIEWRRRPDRTAVGPDSPAPLAEREVGSGL